MNHMSNLRRYTFLVYSLPHEYTLGPNLVDVDLKCFQYQLMS